MFKPAYIVSIYNDEWKPVYFEFADEQAAIECGRKYKSFGFFVRIFQQIPFVY